MWDAAELDDREIIDFLIKWKRSMNKEHATFKSWAKKAIAYTELKHS